MADGQQGGVGKGTKCCLRCGPPHTQNPPPSHSDTLDLGCTGSSHDHDHDHHHHHEGPGPCAGCGPVSLVPGQPVAGMPAEPAPPQLTRMLHSHHSCALTSEHKTPHTPAHSCQPQHQTSGQPPEGRQQQQRRQQHGPLTSWSGQSGCEAMQMGSTASVCMEKGACSVRMKQ